MPDSARDEEAREEKAHFPAALQPELVLAAQKDVYFASQLADELSGLIEGVFGTRALSTWSAELQFAAHLAYFSLTS